MKFRSVANGIEIAVALHKFYPTVWKAESYLRLLANSETLQRLQSGETAEAISAGWKQELTQFREARSRALIYAP
jgi:hypothetical protein